MNQNGANGPSTDKTLSPPFCRCSFRQFQLSKFAFTTVIVAIGTTAMFAWHYRAHLYWCYVARQLRLENVQDLPVQQMPDIVPPSDWVRCCFNGIEFSLPKELANGRDSRQHTSTVAIFEHDTRMVIVDVPSEGTEIVELQQTASRLSPQSQGFTMPQLREACYRARSKDFRWTMTRNEVRWHTFCIVTGELIRTSSNGHIETNYRKDMDSIVHFSGTRTIMYWNATDHNVGGYIRFVDRSGGNDSTWIRAICNSCKIVEHTNPEKDCEHVLPTEL